jgi:hypothetical protein
MSGYRGQGAFSLDDCASLMLELSTVVTSKSTVFGSVENIRVLLPSSLVVKVNLSRRSAVLFLYSIYWRSQFIM